MTCEIDKDFYCTNSEDFISSDGTEVRCDTDHYCETCRNMRRKWPTPEQYMEERGVEWKGAVYYLEKAFAFAGWNTTELWTLEKEPVENYIIVCACTDWSKPVDDWRPS